MNSLPYYENEGPQIIKKYFPQITEKQYTQFIFLNKIYQTWNIKINIISRKDIENLYLHHILHSLAINKVIIFKENTTILDLGTGGGFPGIPLAITNPQCQFKLIDGTKKKINVVQDIIKTLSLENCTAEQIRGEQEQEKFNYIISRAVMTLKDIVKITAKNISKHHTNVIPNGYICLKGGNISSEIEPFKNIVETYEIKNFYEEKWFENKYIIYLPT